MDAALDPVDRQVPVRGLRLHIRTWKGAGQAFVLVHGLASNARTWDAVAQFLTRSGHRVVALDQRGHGVSDKPAKGYGFDEVTADLWELLRTLGLQRPLLVGQSWGGNVVLELAKRYPEAAAGVVLVDGGFIELSARPGATWEQTAIDLRPPAIAGIARVKLAAEIRRAQPEWSEEGIEATLANFETLPDGTIRPWLTLERHLEILRALWEHKPSAIYPQVTAPVLLAAADDGAVPPGRRKEAEVARAEAGLRRVRVHWFRDTAHDVHVHRPEELAALMLETLWDGFFE